MSTIPAHVIETKKVSIVDVFLEIQPMLQRLIISKTGSTHVAQDLTQDIYFRVMSFADKFSTDNDAKNYLIRVAINASVDYLRVEGRRKQLLSSSMAMFENYVPVEPENSILIEEQVQALDDALTELPEKCRQILYFSRVEGMTHAEIAQKLGVSQSLVEKYIIRALKHCRKNVII